MNNVSFEAANKLFEEVQITLTDVQYRKFSEYAALLISESAHQNVTAVREPQEIWIRHFLDSAVLLPYISDGATVLDMGTGGGIPAIPLAILNPSLRITMLDSEQSKIEFCKRAVSSLGLSADCICGRAEEIAHDQNYREQFDFVVSRAMAAGSMLSELSVPFLKVNGSLLSMKGRSFDDEAERFSSAAAELHCTCEMITYELHSEQKTLVVLTKQTETGAKYPRRFAKIKRSPL